MGSGVTIGPGLDLRHFSSPEHAYKEMVKIGVDEATALALSPAAGLYGVEAQAWADAHHDITISDDEQVNIFNHMIPQFENSMYTALDKLAHDHPGIVIPDHLSDAQRQAIFDINYNVSGGIATYPRFVEAFFNGDYASAQIEAIRHADGKELYNRDQDFNVEFLTPPELHEPDLHDDRQSALDQAQTVLTANEPLNSYDSWDLVSIHDDYVAAPVAPKANVAAVMDHQDYKPQDSDSDLSTMGEDHSFTEPQSVSLEALDGGFTDKEVYENDKTLHAENGTIIDPADRLVYEYVDFVEGPTSGNIFEDAINRIHHEFSHPVYDQGGILGTQSTLYNNAPITETDGQLKETPSTFSTDTEALSQNEPIMVIENEPGFFVSLFGADDTSIEHVHETLQTDIPNTDYGPNSIFTNWAEPVDSTTTDNRIAENNNYNTTFDWGSDHIADTTISIFEPTSVSDNHAPTFDWSSDSTVEIAENNNHNTTFDWGSEPITDTTASAFDPAPVSDNHVLTFDWGSDYTADDTTFIYNADPTPVVDWSSPTSDIGYVDNGHLYTESSAGSDSFSNDPEKSFL
ncbi:hypothetical protein GCM10027442_12410 [Emticicia fontis]